MEQLSSPEQKYLVKAHAFMAENTPSLDELDQYRHERLARVHEGEKLWIAKEIGHNVRTFELLDGIKHSKEAVLIWNILSYGLDAYKPIIYGAPELEEEYRESISSAERWLGSRGMGPMDREFTLLGMVLEKVEELTA
jgi:hypothetical protein